MKTTQKTKVPALWYRKQIEWIKKDIENKKKILKSFKVRAAAMEAGYPTKHDAEVGVTLSDLLWWIERTPKEIADLEAELKQHKLKFQPCPKTFPNWNKFQQFWVDNLQKLIDYEMDYYKVYYPLTQECFICDNPDDEECEAETEIAELIQQITGVNDLVRFR